MNKPVQRQRTTIRRRSVARVVVVAAVLLLGWPAPTAHGAVGPGASALLAAEVDAKLNLSISQRQQIQSIARATAKKFSEAQTAKRGQPGLKRKLNRIRQASRDEAVALLAPEKKTHRAKPRRPGSAGQP